MSDKYRSELPIPQTFYRRTLSDIVQYYETVFKSEQAPLPKLVSYRRLPSVTSSSVARDSDKDTVSDSEVTNLRVTKQPYVTRSCRTSPTASDRLATTVFETTFSLSTQSSCNDSDTNMADSDAVESDRKKTLRQVTIEKSMNKGKGKAPTAMSHLMNALPGVPGISKIPTMEATPSTPKAGEAVEDTSTPLSTKTVLSDLGDTPGSSTQGTLLDDSMLSGEPPSRQPENLQLLSSSNIVIQGGGGLGPEFQATLDDPEELTYPPATWDAGLEKELQYASGCNSNNSMQSVSSQGTPKRQRKNTQKKTSKKKNTGRGEKSKREDESVSSSSE